MFNGIEQPKRGRGRPPKSKAPAAEIPLVKPPLLLSDDEDDDYQPNWAATGVGFSQVVRHIGDEANQHKAVGSLPHIGLLKLYYQTLSRIRLQLNNCDFSRAMDLRLLCVWASLALW